MRNHKALMKEKTHIKEGIFLHGMTQIEKMTVLLKVMFWYNASPVETATDFKLFEQIILKLS